MTLILSLCFLGSWFAVLFSYLVYPWILRMQNPGKAPFSDLDHELKAFPKVAVLMAAYNEEQVIADKLKSVFQTSYPIDKLVCYVGSDASTDRTNALVTAAQKRFGSLVLVDFPGRTGKPAILNRLVSMCEADILILTDANVFFQTHTISKLVKAFEHPAVGMAGAQILKFASRNQGISAQELRYMDRENKIKRMESNLWGSAIGIEGGCMAIRKEMYSPIPPGFLVDDFFLNMQVLKKGKMALLIEQAICTEETGYSSEGEFKRKARISAGNFKNLIHFRSMLAPIWKGASFAFWSHKVLRWFSPFFLLMALASSFVLMFQNPAWQWAFGFNAILWLSPAIQGLLSYLNLGKTQLKSVAHFMWMNVALLSGFFTWLKGGTASTWERSART
jgi:cellulose synthase/poly-beta-1,6-N-acetylglucosamine synthase-like glycosyltransferase